LLHTQHRGDGNRRMAVGTLDGHAPSSLIDHEVITAGLTFEEDIGHLLTPKAVQFQSELGKTSCRQFLAASIAYLN
jgi:hypothetical protein